METKKSFLLYIDTYDAIKDLPVEEKAQLLDAIFQYHINPENPVGSLGSGAKIAFNFLVSQFKRDLEKYNNVIERNRKNGLKGGRPKTQKTQNNPEKPKKPDSNSDSERDIKTDSASTVLSVQDTENLQVIDCITSEDISEVAQLFSISEEDVRSVHGQLRDAALKGKLSHLIKDARKTLEQWVKKQIGWGNIQPAQTLEEIIREQTGDKNLKIS
jgi:hypothetical protein